MSLNAGMEVHYNNQFMLKAAKEIVIIHDATKPNQTKLIFQIMSPPLYEMISSLQLETIPGA